MKKCSCMFVYVGHWNLLKDRLCLVADQQQRNYSDYFILFLHISVSTLTHNPSVVFYPFPNLSEGVTGAASCPETEKAMISSNCLPAPHMRYAAHVRARGFVQPLATEQLSLGLPEPLPPPSQTGEQMLMRHLTFTSITPPLYPPAELWNNMHMHMHMHCTDWQQLKG